MIRLFPLILVVACATEPLPSGEALTFDDGVMDATLPPPTAVTLDAPAFATAGAPFALTVPDALSDETVFFITGSGPGDGPCPRPLGGYCLDLAPPVAFVGRADTDDGGVATAAIDAPRFPGAELCYQAVIRRGPGGLVSAFSAVECVEFCADVDEDGDGVCDAFDVCVGADEVEVVTWVAQDASSSCEPEPPQAMHRLYGRHAWLR